jgi:PDZ domain-containing secreted protein
MDGQKIATYADLSGYINTKRPNDKIQVTYTRKKNNVVPVVLSKMNSKQFKGIELENIDAAEKEIQY